MMETQYTLQLITTGGYLIVGLFVIYAVIAIYRPESIARMWAFRLGLIFFALALALPMLGTLLSVSTQVSSYGTGGRSTSSTMIYQVMVPVCGFFFAASIVATLGSLLPRIVFIAPKDDRPPRNPFE